MNVIPTTVLLNLYGNLNVANNPEIGDFYRYIAMKVVNRYKKKCIGYY